MRTEQIAENIYRIPVGLPNNPLKELNSYLIKDEERSLLIDTGFRMKPCYDDMVAGLTELDVDMDQTDIFLTHMHSDHAGLAGDLIKEGGKIYVGEVDYPYLQMDVNIMKTDDPEEAFNEYIASYYMAGVPKSEIEETLTNNAAVKFAPPKEVVTYTPIPAGTTFEKGGYLWECIATPGHTPGHLCLWNEEHQIMFTGDHVLFDITPNITRWPNVADSLGDYITSLKMIRNYDVKLALPGHRATGNFHERIDTLLLHHDLRAKEAEDIIGDREPAGVTAYDTAAELTWDIKAKDWAHFPPGQKFFALGETMAHLDYLEKEGRINKVISDKGVYLYHVV